jgi:purine-binding chemotaxis protein CheW
MSDLQQRYESTLSAIRHGASDSDVKQFISFRVGAEDYAIDILAVREIKGWTQTTCLPNQPDYVRGVLNLRGAIVPVFDLRCRFGRGATKATAKHVVIIVSLADRLAGLLVDQVSDILSVSPDAIGPVPEIDAGQSQSWLSGLVTINDAMVVLLSLENLFETTALAGGPSLEQSAA